jgi:hypothetical protein
MNLPPDWSEFIALLCSHRVRFLVVGAHALAAHGRPRATGDLDLWVEPTPANAERVGRAIRKFGFERLGSQTAAFAQPDRMATMGRPPLRIDVMTSVSGLTFRRAWRRRIVTRFGQHEIGFLGRADLLENKRASGRPKDLADIALLLEADEANAAAEAKPAPVPAAPRQKRRRPASRR